MAATPHYITPPIPVPRFLVLIDARAGILNVDVPDATLSERSDPGPGSEAAADGMGRELFEMFRRNASDTEAGATVLWGLGS